MSSVSPDPVVDHWERHALNWRHFGSPLRPSVEDIAWFEQNLASESLRSYQAVLLGVTPEIVGMHWPAGMSLLAMDQCPAMIRSVWPKDGVPDGARVMCGDWNRMPLPEHGADAVVGDGVLVVFSVPVDVRRLMAEVKRVLHANGIWLLRVFVRPDVPETLEQVHEDLFAGRIGSFHAYKWRLAMAMHRSLAEGVRPAEVWGAWRERVPDPVALGERTGWSQQSIRTIDAYQNSAATYYFPTLGELREILGEGFDVVDVHFSQYELGPRCPLVALRPLS